MANKRGGPGTREQCRQAGLNSAALFWRKRKTIAILDQNILNLRAAILETTQLLKDLCTELEHNERDLRRCLENDHKGRLPIPRSFSPAAVPPAIPPLSAIAT